MKNSLIPTEVSTEATENVETEQNEATEGNEPTVIEDNKPGYLFADGIVGAYSQAKFEEFLNNNGIK